MEASRARRSAEVMKVVAAAILLVVSGAVRKADAHGAMNIPRSRNMGRSPVDPSPAGGSVNQAGCEEASCMWFNQGW